MTTQEMPMDDNPETDWLDELDRAEELHAHGSIAAHGNYCGILRRHARELIDAAKEVQRPPECVHCTDRDPDIEHWQTCDAHPARKEIDNLCVLLRRVKYHVDHRAGSRAKALLDDIAAVLV